VQGTEGTNFEHPTRETIIRQRRGHDMERWLAVSSLQQRQHLRNFEKASRPSMYKQKRDGALDLALLMQEVHVKRSEAVDCDLRFELWQ
jgi:hypothetical protein